MPVNELSNIIKDNTQVIVLSLLMLVSFFSIFFSYNIIFSKDQLNQMLELGSSAIADIIEKQKACLK